MSRYKAKSLHLTQVSVFFRNGQLSLTLQIISTTATTSVYNGQKRLKNQRLLSSGQKSLQPQRLLFMVNRSRWWTLIVATLLIISEQRHKKSRLCLFKNKGTNQMCSKCTADQHLCFRYSDSTIPLRPKSKISSY